MNMVCIHAGRVRESKILCRAGAVSRWIPATTCEDCPLFVAGIALPLPSQDAEHTVVPPDTSPCQHLGESQFDEPCSCGASLRVSVHACHCPTRVRSFQQHAWCVPLSLNWDRLADPMARTSFQCCETCQHRSDPQLPVSDTDRTIATSVTEHRDRVADF